MSALAAVAIWCAVLASVAILRAVLKARHNPRSGGCCYFSYSFDSLRETCAICEKSTE